MDALDIQVGRWSSTTVVTLRGELDLATAPRLGDLLDEIAGDAILDLRQVGYIDSTGVRLLLRRDADFRSRGRTLTILRGSRVVQRMFELTDADRWLQLVG
jgi:anti-anti-sigma factor